MNSAPCSACDKRYVGCHADCEEYKRWKAKMSELSERRYNVQKAEKMINSYVSIAKRKYTRFVNKEK